MKKTYSTPAMLEIHINMRGIICGSYLTQQGDNLEGSLFTTNAEGEGLVKEISTKNIWDDQW